MRTQKLGATTYLVEPLQVEVPELWSQRSGNTFSLPVVRFRREQGLPVAPLFYLNGGPGTSNLSLASVPRFLRDGFEVVLVGYRGVDGPHRLRFSRLRRELGRFSFRRSPRSIRRTEKAFLREIAALGRRSLVPAMFGIDQVVEDLERVRSFLGIGKARVYGVSYGTRLAYLWSARHPDGISCVVQEAVNPPGRFVWEARDINDTWKAIDQASGAGSPPALPGTLPSELVLGVLERMPGRWGLLPLDRGRIEAMLFGILFNIDNLPLVIALFSDAEKGKYAGLAALSCLFPLVVRITIPFAGDFFLKGLVDFDRRRNYGKDLLFAPGFGSFLGLVLWSWVKEGPGVGPAGESPGRTVTVPTLLLSGDLDFSTPHRYARTEMLPRCTRPTTLLVRGAGHMNIVEDDNTEVLRRVKDFLTGVPVANAEVARTPKPPVGMNFAIIGRLLQILVVLAWVVPLVVALTLPGGLKQ